MKALSKRSFQAIYFMTQSSDKDFMKRRQNHGYDQKSCWFGNKADRLRHL